MSKVYFGLFEDYDDMRGQFNEMDNPDFPSPDQILAAFYEYEDYSGDAFVLFEKDGQLFEVNGGHCSCYGLEGTWEPEDTTWGAVVMRKFHGEKDLQDRITELALAATGSADRAGREGEA